MDGVRAEPSADSPEYAGRLPGPHKPDERDERGARHPILAGFDKTDILPYGGPLGPLTVDSGRTVLATFVPGFPFSPIDEVYMRVERTTIPGIIVGTFGKGRVVFLLRMSTAGLAWIRSWTTPLC